MRMGFFVGCIVLAALCVRAEGVRAGEPEGVPELMRTFAGEEVNTLRQWREVRRPELLKTFQEEEYGVRPVERPADLAFEETAPVEDCFGGRAIRKRVRATYSGPGGREKIDFSVWIPKREKPVAVFVHSSPRPAETAADPDGPRPVYLLPAERIVSRGYAVVAYCNQDVAADSDGPDAPTGGVFRAYGPKSLKGRAPDEWGIVSAWAWGMSRIADWIETEPLLDAKRIAAIGLSRNGKTALWAGATDPRFALTVSCCSGCGGAKLNHMKCPASESVGAILKASSWKWFCGNFAKYVGHDRDAKLPFDQHELLALVAPRLLYVSSAEEDAWAGPRGEEASARLASEAWRLYRRLGFGAEIGYHRRAGLHDITAYDWDRYLDFADRHGWKGVRKGRIVTRLDGAGWSLDGVPVSVPHTWNAVDGADGQGPKASNSVSAPSYAHRRGTYVRALPDAQRRRRYFVRCLGASQKAVVRVNGTEIGRHVGAFTAFAFEATKAMKPEGNVLEIEVDNIVDGNVAPVAADFTVYGGLYRGVEFIETDPICIDCVTDGALGVALEPDAATGEVVARVSVDGGTNEVRRFSFPDRELWSPENPRLYSVEVTVNQGGSSDTVRETFGFRTAEFREDGFYLNGAKRRIRGVNYHQDMDGHGWAVSEEQHAKDIALMKEMGADGLRTAHYPHAGATYGECDRQGLLVWCEYPNVNDMGVTETYRRGALGNIREMIAQLRNHPSIVCWSVANEYRTNSVVSHAWLKRLIGEFTAEAKRLDPSRAAVAATCRSFLTDVNMIPDAIGFNFYPGWYRRAADEMPQTIDAAVAETPRRTIGVTEYGAGADIDCHESPEVRNMPLTDFHSEEYQAFVHHGNYLTLSSDDRIWGSFVWAMFDFGADARREGSRYGLNDKGLVTFDHAVRKDAFHFYKANWTPEPMLHLVGKRMSSTTNDTVTVMAFYNGEGPVSLKVNGESLPSVRADAVRTATWTKVPLKTGDNAIEVSAGNFVEKANWRLVK